MNKYIKILTFAVGIMGATSPLALNNKNMPAKYSSVKQSDRLNIMSNTHDKTNELSRIKYNLSINTADPDVKFVSAIEDPDHDLSNEDAIDYLSANLDEAVMQYEELKASLSSAIKDTMDYLDKCNNNEIELDNEQKLQVKERYNTIKYLAETLEDLSEDVICCIDGCEEDEDLDIAAGKYISAINALEDRIITLQNAIDAIYHPLEYSWRLNPSYVYGFMYHSPDTNGNFMNDELLNSAESDSPDQFVDNQLSSDNLDDQDKTNNQLINPENEDTSHSLHVEDGENNSDNAVNSTNDPSDEDKDDDKSEAENTNADKPTTFGLKSNIDTYGPSNKRNIDTFFNTALLDDRYGYGYNNGYYGYGLPYGNGCPNGYGYNGNMNGYGLNSNSINRNDLEQEVNAPVEVKAEQTSPEQKNNPASEDKIKDSSTPNKIKKDRAKNIDTYNQTTVQSNINTMGESKISRFFKEKFNNLRDKVKNRKQKKDSNIEDDYGNNPNLPSNINSNEDDDNSIINDEEHNTHNVESQVDGLQDVSDLNNSINDVNNKINPRLEGVKIEKEIMPDAR